MGIEYNAVFPVAYEQIINGFELSKPSTMSEERFSPEQSLQLIGSMINTAKGRFSENGHLYLLWGWTVFVCSIAQFILMNYLQFEHHYMVWMLTWLVFIYQMIYINRQQKKVKVRTYMDEIMGVVWITFVILMFLFGFLLGMLMGDDYYRYINPAFLALYGMPTVLSGTILKFRPLVLGGVCCWLLSVVSTFVPYEYQLLLLAAAVGIAWIVPGYILRNKFKKTL